MRSEFEIKPFTHDEKQRLRDSIQFDVFSIFFFILLLVVLTCSFIYTIYLSMNILVAIFTVAIVVGTYFFFIPLIKSFISKAKYSNMVLKRDEKYCHKGIIERKWFIQPRSFRSAMAYFYIKIDDEEFNISQENYDDLEIGDNVYYEVKKPLYTEVQKL